MNYDNQNLIEAACRAICKADGVDPDKEGVGLGEAIPKGDKYRMWEARRRQAVAVLKVVRERDDLVKLGLCND